MQESFRGKYIITFQMNNTFQIIYLSARARFHLSSFFFLLSVFPYLFFWFLFPSYFGLILGLFLIRGFCKIISIRVSQGFFVLFLTISFLILWHISIWFLSLKEEEASE
jgi:hypothetical protein